MSQHKEFNKGVQTTSTVIPKRDFQEILKQFKHIPDCEVEKLNAGYQVTIKDSLVLKAMNGARGYLVRYVDNLFNY